MPPVRNVFGKLVKSLFDSEAGAELTLEAVEKAYWEIKEHSPEAGTHWALANAWMARMRIKGMNPRSKENEFSAYFETALFACLDEPDNVRALGLQFVAKELPHAFQHHPRLVQDFKRLMSPIRAAHEDNSLASLYVLHNPYQKDDDIATQCFRLREQRLDAPGLLQF